MAFPSVRSTSSGNSGGNATTHNVTLPATIVADDILLVFFSNDGTATASVTTPASGWNQLIAAYANTTTNTARGTIFWRRADGTEDGTSITVTVTSSEGAAWTCYAISGAHTSTNPEAASAGTTSSATPDPPNLDPAGWGTEDTMWLVGYMWDGNVAHSAYPTNYTVSQLTQRWANSGGAGVASAVRTDSQLASENPGTGSIASSEQWTAMTVAIRPAPSGTLYTTTFNASLTFTGAIAKETKKPLSGALTFAGSIAKQTNKALAGALTFAGSIAKQTNKALAGALTFAGSLSASRVYLKEFTASLSFTGALSRQTNKALAGGLTFSGTLSKSISRSFAAGLSFTTSFSKLTSRSFSAGLTFVGSLVKLTSRSFSAGLTFAGTISKSISRSFAATLLFSGQLSRSTLKTLTAALTFSGSIAKETRRTLSAGLSFVGGLIGDLIPGGGGGNLYLKEFTASLSFSGVLTTSHIRSFFDALRSLGPRPRYWHFRGLRPRR